MTSNELLVRARFLLRDDGSNYGGKLVWTGPSGSPTPIATFCVRFSVIGALWYAAGQFSLMYEDVDGDVRDATDTNDYTALKHYDEVCAAAEHILCAYRDSYPHSESLVHDDFHKDDIALFALLELIANDVQFALGLLDKAIDATTPKKFNWGILAASISVICAIITTIIAVLIAVMEWLTFIE